jgi:glycosyltransferase involved in cell wall biosynthesis
VIAFVGSLKPWHGVERLLEAHERLLAAEPSAHLLMIGAGPMLPDVEAAAQSLGPEHVTVAGEIPHSDIPTWLRHADVGVAPYPDLSGFYFSPLKVTEYMAAGLPVVASRVGQLRELVQHQVTGLLVAPGDVDELSRSLLRLARNPELCRRMGRRARSRAESHHSWDRVVGQIEEVLEKLARKFAFRRMPSSAQRLASGGVR